LRFAVSFAITFTTAALLRSASYRLLPRSRNAFVPPKPLTVPACWAPSLPSRLSRNNAPLFISTGSQTLPSSTIDISLQRSLVTDLDHNCPSAHSAQSGVCPAHQLDLQGACSPANRLPGAVLRDCA
jgi:hypothetical protein